jgi:hypothetical protein
MQAKTRKKRKKLPEIHRVVAGAFAGSAQKAPRSKGAFYGL